MTDKEIGELWTLLQKPGLDVPTHRIQDLIRKLIEERRRYYHATEPQAHTWDNATAWALRDFGIDPEEYKVAR